MLTFFIGIVITFTAEFRTLFELNGINTKRKLTVLSLITLSTNKDIIAKKMHHTQGMIYYNLLVYNIFKYFYLFRTKAPYLVLYMVVLGAASLQGKFNYLPKRLDDETARKMDKNVQPLAMMKVKKTHILRVSLNKILSFLIRMSCDILIFYIIFNNVLVFYRTIQFILNM